MLLGNLLLRGIYKVSSAQGTWAKPGPARWENHSLGAPGALEHPSVRVPLPGKKAKRKAVEVKGRYDWRDVGRACKPVATLGAWENCGWMDGWVDG